MSLPWVVPVYWWEIQMFHFAKPWGGLRSPTRVKVFCKFVCEFQWNSTKQPNLVDLKHWFSPTRILECVSFIVKTGYDWILPSTTLGECFLKSWIQIKKWWLKSNTYYFIKMISCYFWVSSESLQKASSWDQFYSFSIPLSYNFRIDEIYEFRFLSLYILILTDMHS